MNKKLLITGAGFSANFGAPVASGIWNYIFNCAEIHNNVKIKKCLLKHLDKSDFESFYNEILSDENIIGSDKKIVVKIISHIFNEINSIPDPLILPESIAQISLKKLFKFLKIFSNTEQGTGFIFTLNQDLLLEKIINRYLRKFDEFKMYSLTYPGAINSPYLDDNWKITLPDENQLKEWLDMPNLGGNLLIKRNFPQYVKLHGSSGWLKSNDKFSMPVIGKNKSYQIHNQPLLKWYLNLLEDQLKQTLDIWIIGYSFSDEHINKLLVNSMINHNSSLYVVDLKGQIDFMNYVKNQGGEIYKAIESRLKGYFPCELKKLFPDKSKTTNILHSMFLKSLNNENISSSLDYFIEVE